MTSKTCWLVPFVAFYTISIIQAQNLAMYVSDAGNFDLPPWQILKFDANGQNGKVFISDHLAWPQDILFLEDENTVLISNLNSGEILRFDATTGAYKTTFATGIGGPTRMKIGPNGLLYVLQWQGNGKVYRYQIDGTFVDEFTSAGVVASIGLDWDTQGNLYVSSYNGFVQKFSPSGTNLGPFISSGLAGPTNIWFEENGDLLVFDYNAASVKRFDSNGVFKNVFISSVPQCEGIAFLPNGNLLVGVGGTSSVREYTPSGSFLNTVVSPGTLGLLTPNAVVLRQETITSVTSEGQIFRDVNIVTPSIGVHFQFLGSEFILLGSVADVTNAAGVIVKKIMVSDSISWDATDLPNGIYVITMPLNNNYIARQSIVVQR